MGALKFTIGLVVFGEEAIAPIFPLQVIRVYISCIKRK